MKRVLDEGGRKVSLTLALWLRGSLWLRGLSGGPLCGSLRAATRHLIVATSWFGGSLRRAATRLPVQSCFMKPSHLRSRAGHAGRGLSRARLSPEVKKTAVTVGRSECRARTTGLRIWPHKQLGTPRARDVRSCLLNELTEKPALLAACYVPP